MNSPQIPYKSPQQLDQTVPLVSRVRHELRLRNTLVMQTQQITPNMVRITLSGPELQGFTSLSPDDHVKLFIPAGASDAACKHLALPTQVVLALTFSAIMGFLKD
jgi:NADPH-dependent ferric siderophore reductase